MRFECVLDFLLKVFNNLPLRIISCQITFCVGHLIGNSIHVTFNFHDNSGDGYVPHKRQAGIYAHGKISLCNKMILVTSGSRYTGAVPVQHRYFLSNITGNNTFDYFSTFSDGSGSEPGSLMLLDIFNNEISSFDCNKATRVRDCLP